MQTKL